MSSGRTLSSLGRTNPWKYSAGAVFCTSASGAVRSYASGAAPGDRHRVDHMRIIELEHGRRRETIVRQRGPQDHAHRERQPPQDRILVAGFIAQPHDRHSHARRAVVVVDPPAADIAAGKQPAIILGLPNKSVAVNRNDCPRSASVDREMAARIEAFESLPGLEQVFERRRVDREGPRRLERRGVAEIVDRVLSVCDFRGKRLPASHRGPEIEIDRMWIGRLFKLLGRFEIASQPIEVDQFPGGDRRLARHTPRGAGPRTRRDRTPPFGCGGHASTTCRQTKGGGALDCREQAHAQGLGTEALHGTWAELGHFQTPRAVRGRERHIAIVGVGRAASLATLPAAQSLPEREDRDTGGS